MLAEVICKECDLTIDHGSFDYEDRITMGTYMVSMISHYKATGHTLLSTVFNMEEIDTEGD